MYPVAPFLPLNAMSLQDISNHDDYNDGDQDSPQVPANCYASFGERVD